MRKFLFILILFLMVVCVFASPFQTDLPKQITYKNDTYYLHSIDSAAVGDYEEYEGEGAIPLTQAVINLFKGIFSYVPSFKSVPDEVYDLMTLESQRIEVLAKLKVGQEINTHYAEALRALEIAKSSGGDAAEAAANSLSNSGGAWKRLIDYLTTLKASGASKFERAAASKWLSNIAASGDEGTVVMLDVFSKGKTYKIMFTGTEQTARLSSGAMVSGESNIFAFAKESLAKITAKMNAVGGPVERLNAAGYTVTTGSHQGLEIIQGGKTIVRSTDVMGDVFDVTRLSRAGWINNIDDVFMMQKYVSSLNKLELLFLSRAGKVMTALQKVQSSTTPAELAKAKKTLTRTIDGANKLFQKLGHADISFTLADPTNLAAGIKVTKTGVSVPVTIKDATQLVALLDIGADSAKLGILARSGLALKKATDLAKAGAAFSKAKFVSWSAKHSIISKFITWPAKVIGAPFKLAGKILRPIGKISLNALFLAGTLTWRTVALEYCYFWVKDQDPIIYGDLSDPRDTKFYLKNGINPTLLLNPDFGLISQCIDSTYEAVIGQQLTMGYASNETTERVGAIGNAAFEFIDMSSFAQLAIGYANKKINNMEFGECETAIYSKTQPDSVTPIRDISLNGGYGCEEFENVILSDNYPEGDYIGFTRISAGEGAADWLTEPISLSKSVDSKHDSKLLTYNITGVCKDEAKNYGAWMGATAAKESDALSEENVEDYLKSIDTMSDCIKRNGYFTQIVEFKGAGELPEPVSSILSGGPRTGYVVFIPTVDQIKQIEKDHGSMDKYDAGTKWVIKQGTTIIASSDSTDPNKLAFFKRQGTDWFFVVNNLTTLVDSQNNYDVEVTFTGVGKTIPVKIIVGAKDSDVKAGVCTTNMFVNKQTETCYNPNSTVVVTSNEPLKVSSSSIVETHVVEDTTPIAQLKAEADNLKKQLEEQKIAYEKALGENKQLRVNSDVLIVKLADLTIQMQTLETGVLIAQQAKEYYAENLIELEKKQSEQDNLSEQEKQNLAGEINDLKSQLESFQDDFQKKASELDQIKEEYEKYKFDSEKKLKESGLDAQRAEISRITEENHFILTQQDFEQKEEIYVEKIDKLKKALASSQQCNPEQIVPEIPNCSISELDSFDSRTKLYQDISSMPFGGFIPFSKIYSTGLQTFTAKHAVISLGNNKFSFLSSAQTNQLEALSVPGKSDELRQKAFELARTNPGSFDLELIQTEVTNKSSSQGMSFGDDGKVLVLSTNKLGNALLQKNYIKIAYPVDAYDETFLLKSNASVWQPAGIN
ncbi:MAG: hypothetical protein WC915_03595 [archaeon]|jgi:hypothetical protein